MFTNVLSKFELKYNSATHKEEALRVDEEGFVYSNNVPSLSALVVKNKFVDQDAQIIAVTVSPIHAIKAYMTKELTLNGVSKLRIKSFDVFGREFDSSFKLESEQEDEEEEETISDFKFFLVNGEDQVVKLEKNNLIRGMKVRGIK